MPRYIAFLRAINIGGRNVKMEQLRDQFAELGFSDVESFIASGNIIFRSPPKSTLAFERKIEKHLHRVLGYEVATFIRTPDELAKIAEHQPFPKAEMAESYSLYISFLKAPADEETAKKVAELCTGTNLFHLHETELYWLCKTKLSESRVSGAMLEKAIGAPSTMRNSTTIRKVAAKFSG